jgi:hypothetical protein
MVEKRIRLCAPYKPEQLLYAWLIALGGVNMISRRVQPGLFIGRHHWCLSPAGHVNALVPMEVLPPGICQPSLQKALQSYLGAARANTLAKVLFPDSGLPVTIKR